MSSNSIAKDYSEARDHIPREARHAAVTAAIESAPNLLDGPPPPDEAGTESPRPIARPLNELQRPGDHDPNELIRKRYLCRGGGLLLVGPSGIGKSSFGMQLALCFAIGRPAFEISPARPMKILIIQAENDDGDMAEMRDGVLAGLGFTAQEEEQACANVYICRDDEHAGEDFFSATVLPLLNELKPELLFIDPAHAYHGGDSSSQQDVSRFLRQQLNPVIRKQGCGVIIVHHTNKPPSGKEKSAWSGSDFAYLGSGSAEWANWSRAVLAIRQHSEGVFELIAGKRGGRLRWKEDDGETPTIRKFIRHHATPGVICWEEVPPDEAPDPKEEIKSKPTATVVDLQKLLSPSKLYRKDTLLSLAKAAGIGRDRCRELISELLDEGKLFEHRIPRSGTRPEIQYACYPNQSTHSTAA